MPYFPHLRPHQSVPPEVNGTSVIWGAQKKELHSISGLGWDTRRGWDCEITGQRKLEPEHQKYKKKKRKRKNPLKIEKKKVMEHDVHLNSQHFRDGGRGRC